MTSPIRSGRLLRRRTTGGGQRNGLLASGHLAMPERVLHYRGPARSDEKLDTPSLPRSLLASMPG